MSGCSTIHRNTTQKTITIKQLTAKAGAPSDSIINVWVHGTTQNPLLRNWHASPKGIVPLADLSDSFTLRELGHLLHEHDSVEFPKDNFYTFGWSGKLSFAARKEAGEQLSEALRTIVDVHQMRYRQKPRIRLITHSHGCNVALNAADLFSQSSDPIVIDELVLLACPVQEATAAKLKSGSFKRIFSLYSTLDLTQVLDPQGLNMEGMPAGGNLFSNRRFEPQGNLIQARMRWKGIGLSHFGFVRERFAKALPSILAELRSSESADFLIDVQPE